MPNSTKQCHNKSEISKIGPGFFVIYEKMISVYHRDMYNLGFRVEKIELFLDN